MKTTAKRSEEVPRHVYIHEALAGQRQTETTDTLSEWAQKDLRGEASPAEIASLLSLENVRIWKDLLKKKAGSIQRQLEKARKGEYPPSVEDEYKWRGRALSALRAIGLRLAEARDVIRTFDSERSSLARKSGAKRQVMWIPLRFLACRNCDHRIVLKEGESLPNECSKCGMTFDQWDSLAKEQAQVG
jgi:hypothetical protein